MLSTTDWRRRRNGVFILVFSIVVAIGFYDLFVRKGYTLGRWLASPLDWLFIAANVVLVFYVVIPLLFDRNRSAKLWNRLCNHPESITGFSWLIIVYFLGTVGIALAPKPKVDFLHKNQPPIFTSISTEYVTECAGRVTGGRCFGTWQYPLGTDLNGYALEILLLQGLHITLYVAVISLAFIIPLALSVGVTAGYWGGWPDLLLMRSVEIQDAIPPLIVYLLVIFITGKSLLIILLLFGFLGWGGTSRIVRNEARRVSESEFVSAARALGSTDRHIIRTHVLPSVSGVAIPTATQKVPVLLLTEAGLAYLGLEAFELQSFGNIIARGTVRGEVPMTAKWWVSGIALVTFVATIVSFKLVSDAFVESFDPRIE